MKTSITRTGLSSATKSSRHSGSKVTRVRSAPSTNRFMSPLRNNHLLQCRQSFRFGNLRVFPHSTLTDRSGLQKADAQRCGQQARKKRRSRLKRVRLSRVLGQTVLNVGPELNPA
jgi:hypothetical protein